MEEESNFEIRVTDEKGRGLFARKHLAKGDIIFQEVPLVSCQFAWNEDCGYQACELCLRPLETAFENAKRLTMNFEFQGIPHPEVCIIDKNSHICCPNCGVKYCCADCLNLAWNRYHKTLCLHNHKNDNNHPLVLLKEMWKQMHYPPETTSIMLFVKLFAMIHQSDNKDSIRKTIKQFCHNIVNENENITHKLLGLKFADQVEILREAIMNVVPAEAEEWVTHQGFLQLMALVGMNGQGIGTSSFSEWVKNIKKLDLSPTEKTYVDNFIEEIYEAFEKGVGDFLNNEGSGLYIIQSSINHSCKPNAEVTFPNANYQLAVKAVKDINVGEEICISYLDECVLERSRHSRQKVLQENYLFTCKCEKCEEEISQPDETSSDEFEYVSDG